jgi:hypothetical protein
VLGPNGQRELGQHGRKGWKRFGLLCGFGQKLKRNRKMVFELLVAGLNGFKRYLNLNESV